jgi:hypothetical protein
LREISPKFSNVLKKIQNVLKQLSANAFHGISAPVPAKYIFVHSIRGSRLVVKHPLVTELVRDNNL